MPSAGFRTFSLDCWPELLLEVWDFSLVCVVVGFFVFAADDLFCSFPQLTNRETEKQRNRLQGFFSLSNDSSQNLMSVIERVFRKNTPARVAFCLSETCFWELN